MNEGPYPTPPGIHCICRGCGALCDPLAWADRGQLCARCAFPTRVSRITHTLTEQTPGAISVRQVWVNGEEVLGTHEDPDPIRRAIDKACAAWARDEFKEDPNL